MSVLACNRNGCSGIMCDRISDAHGYICNTCFDELVSSGPGTNVVEFMEKERQYEHTTESVRDFFASQFPLQD